MTVDQIRLLSRFTKNVVMLFDSDPAGQAAMIRSLDVLVEQGMNVKVAVLDDNEDPDSFVRRYGVDEFRLRVEKARTLFDFKLDFLSQRFDPVSVEGRTRIATEMLGTINKFENAVMRSEYLKLLSQALAVSENALRTESDKVKRQGPAVKIEQTPKGPARDSIRDLRPVEKDILLLMLEEKEFVPLTREEVAATDFESVQVRDIVAKIYELTEQGQNVSVPVLMSCFDDQGVLGLISELMAKEDVLIGDKKRIHKDCVRRLKEDKVRSQRREILRQMEDARDTGNQKKMDDLTLEFNQLIKG